VPTNNKPAKLDSHTQISQAHTYQLICMSVLLELNDNKEIMKN